MQKKQGNYEKILIIVMAVAAIAAGVWAIMSSQSFAATLNRPQVKEKTFEENIPVDKIEDATKRAVSDANPWTAPVRNNKPVPLFKSVLLVYKDDQIFDMFVKDPQLRTNITNEWIRQHNLPNYLSPNVEELDPDGDGFTNLEEFNGHTDPNDAGSHPPITDKLFLVQRIEHKFLVTLKSADSPPYQVLLVDETGKRNSRFVELNKPFGPPGNTDRFIATKFEKKEVNDPRTNTPKDVSELTIHDNLHKSDLLLIKDVEQNLAEYEAQLEFRLKVIESIKVKKGETFRIPGHDETTYRLLDVQEDGAVISALKSDGTEDKQVSIKRG